LLGTYRRRHGDIIIEDIARYLHKKTWGYNYRGHCSVPAEEQEVWSCEQDGKHHDDVFILMLAQRSSRQHQYHQHVGQQKHGLSRGSFLLKINKNNIKHIKAASIPPAHLIVET
jgi:hypothetical protein